VAVEVTWHDAHQFRRRHSRDIARTSTVSRDTLAVQPPQRAFKTEELAEAAALFEKRLHFETSAAGRGRILKSEKSQSLAVPLQ